MSAIYTYIRLFVVTIVLLSPVFSYAQLYIGGDISLSIQGDDQLVLTEGDLIIDTYADEAITGDGKVVFSGKDLQKIQVKKAAALLATVEVINPKGLHIEGAELHIPKTIHADGAIVFVNHIPISDPTNIAQTDVEAFTHTDSSWEDETVFYPEVLGYATIIHLTDVIQKANDMSKTGINPFASFSVASINNNLIHVPLSFISIKQSSTFYYTLNYTEDDYSYCFHPPKIV